MYVYSEFVKWKIELFSSSKFPPSFDCYYFNLCEYFANGDGKLLLNDVV